MAFLLAVVAQGRRLIWTISRSVVLLLANEALLRRGNVVIGLGRTIVHVMAFGLAKDTSAKIGTHDTLFGTFALAMTSWHVSFWSAIARSE